MEKSESEGRKKRTHELSEPIIGIDRLRQEFDIEILNSIFENASRIEKAELDSSESRPRIPGKFDKKNYQTLLRKYSDFPKTIALDQRALIQGIVSDLLGGVPLWRNPNFQYNVGAAVNRVSSVLYALGLDFNVFNINDGLSGNAIIAEQGVSNILSDLADIDHQRSLGFFTFGGTATNLYGIKLGIAKTFPLSKRFGLTGNIQVLLTEDSHFSHTNALNWLGVGTENVLVVKANDDRTSDLEDAEKKLRLAFDRGIKVPTIVINGGTTYDNAIDNIRGFVMLRDRMVSEYGLDYVPHIHVDSVIGWAWLVFKEYDYEKNPLGIETLTLSLIKSQYLKISELNLADSWGVDLHKGIGSCPIPSSVFMVNDANSLASIAPQNIPDTHQLSREYSEFSPADYTLETSRPGGAALAAIGAFNSLGIEGFQVHLANLVQMNQLLRELIVKGERNDVSVLNHHSPGYVTMVRLYPPTVASGQCDIEHEDVERVNRYMKEFYKYDNEKRINQGIGVEYSFSSKYLKTSSGQNVGALKFYPTSPYLEPKHMHAAAETLFDQKDEFDKHYRD